MLRVVQNDPFADGVPDLVRDGLIAHDDLVPRPRRAEEELVVGIGAAE